VESEVDVNENVRNDASLVVGAVETEVNVTGSATLVDTALLLFPAWWMIAVVDLPLNGRNVIALARILPGVLNVSAPQQLGDARDGPEMDVNGGRPNMNLFTFNGAISTTFPQYRHELPTSDAIQEVRILTHNFCSGIWPQSGSQVSGTKAGTSLASMVRPLSFFVTTL
jgi:hypothetical protein